MLSLLGKKLFGSANDRILKKMQGIVTKVNDLSAKYSDISDEELQSHTPQFQERISKGESLDSILPEAFATAREAAKRVLNMSHFDVQLLGGIVLHRGIIAEMKTGEGKTLVATLPVYLNALSGKGVHVVTVNDYLAQRDAAWMGRLYEFLGLKVGCLTNNMSEDARKEAYEADITYGTNNEFGFDYLRDNLKLNAAEMVQREFNYAIVDEVDSILIDEARTPLIISGPTEDSSELYRKVNQVIPKLIKTDYEIDEKAKNVFLTDEGCQNAEKVLRHYGLIKSQAGLYELENMTLLHHVNQALKAHKLFTKDVDYIVKEGKVQIIDEFTGRIMDGRRYSEGLHQALEAKENTKIQQENQTLASITFQNYFRMYPKLAGMTGTAMTESMEFANIYNLDVVEVPTNKPILRKDEDDEVYKTEKEKFDAIIAEIRAAYDKGQPVLVGTISIEKSEYLSKLLKKNKIKHNILNAKHHAQEAEIIMQAGKPKAVTIATNMAGRGTDIKPGGNEDIISDAGSVESAGRNKEEALKAGGLLVIGTERHESRRIDNQLRGRSGRQGDPGRTKFYLSLEDDLMRIFGSDKISGLLKKLGMKEGEAITHPWITRSLAKAQQKVEGRNFEVRKNLLKFDDVMNEQRNIIYNQRIEIMKAENLEETVFGMAKEVNSTLVASYIPSKALPEEWDIENLEKEITRIYNIYLNLKNYSEQEGVADREILTYIDEAVDKHMQAKIDHYGRELISEASSKISLVTLDYLWKEHLHSLDHLRGGINLRAYAQKDPLNEYKFEAFRMFEAMLQELKEKVVQRLAHLEITTELASTQAIENRGAQIESRGEEVSNHNAPVIRSHVSPEDRDPQDPATWGKVARNEVCPCGSGKKYKHCHGAL